MGQDPRASTIGPAALGLLIVVALLGSFALFSPQSEYARLRQLFSLDEQRRGGDVPGTPFRFLVTQPGSDRPVGYSPCRPIRYVVNPDGAPDDHLEYVETAVARVAEASGLRFELVGTTDSHDRERTSTTQAVSEDLTGRSGSVSEAPPVLVHWATEERVPALAGSVAGLGGSSAAQVRPGLFHFVTGAVTLDADVFGSPLHSRESLQAVVDHEFGHLVGLDHVDDPGELMHEEATVVDRFGQGDLEGLARLGAVPCG